MIATASPITAFYQGEPDYKGRTLLEILDYGNWALEYHHDFIQVLFPLPEASIYNHRAPLLDAATIEAFNEDEWLQVGMVAAYRRMLRFYGFRESIDSKVTRTQNFQRQAKNWLTPHNHNFRRISRILRCLTLCGLKRKAKQFLAALVKLYDQKPRMCYGRVIGWERMYKWEDAVNNPHGSHG